MLSFYENLDHCLDRNREVSRFLKDYDLFSTISYIASLYYFHDLQSNILRFETLSIIAIASCKGTRVFSYNDLRNLLKKYENSPDFRILENDITNTYLSQVELDNEIIHIFEGLDNDASLYLSQLLNSISPDVKEFNNLEEIYLLLKSLLKIQSDILKGMALPINTISGISISDRTPSEVEIEQIRKKILLPNDLIAQYGFNDNNLINFVLSESDIDSLSIEKIYLTPFISNSTYYIFHIPTAISTIVRNVLIYNLEKSQIWDKFKLHFVSQRAKDQLDTLAKKWNLKGGNQVLLKKESYDSNTDYCIFYAAGVSYEKIQVNIIYVRAFPSSRFFERSIQYIPKFDNFNKSPDATDELNLLILSQDGLENEYIDCDFSFYRIKESMIRVFMDDEEFKPIKIKKCLKSFEKINGKIVMSNTNPYSLWKIKKYSFLDILLEQINFCTAENLDVFEIKKYKDRNQCISKFCPFFKRSFILKKIDRNQTDSNTIYASKDTRFGLLGMIYREKRSLWIFLDNHQFDAEFHMRIWHTIAIWSEKIIKQIPDEYLNILDKINDVLIFLDIDIDINLSRETIHPVQEVNFDIQQANNQFGIKVSIRQDFIDALALDNNLGEKTLLKKIFCEILKLRNVSSNHIQVIFNIIDSIFSNSCVRILHVFEGNPFVPENKYRQNIDSLNYVDLDDLQFPNISLFHKGYRPHKDEKDPVGLTKRMANDLLEIFIDKLKKLEPISAIKILLTRLQNISAEYDHWEYTAHSKIAIDGYDEYIQIKEKTEKSKIIIRKLIEVLALYQKSCKFQRSTSWYDLDITIAYFHKILSLTRMSDAIFYNLYGEDKFMLSSTFEIHTEKAHDEIRYFDKQRTVNAITNSAENSLKRYIQEEKETPYPKRLDTAKEAFLLEYGIEFSDFNEFIHCIWEYTSFTDIIEMEYERFLNLLDNATCKKYSQEILEYFLKKIILEGSSECCSVEIMLESKFWMSSRYFSLLFKPIIRTSRNVLITSMNALNECGHYLSRIIANGLYPKDMIINPDFKSLNGQIANDVAKEFESKVASRLKEIGYEVKESKELKIQQNNYGDIDVIAVDHISKKIFIVECKNRDMAITPDEIGKQLKDFKGKEGDLLWKHLRRTSIIKNNLSLLNRFGISSCEGFRVIPVVVTAYVVPMSFINSSDLHFLNFLEMRRLKKELLDMLTFDDKWLIQEI